MWIENLAYILSFVISSGMAVIGILLSYQLYQQHKKPVFATLLYQQIFLFSFFSYGIWGNLALREIIGDLNLTAELTTKLAFFIPVIGIPFMVVSWFMLLKFGFNLNGYKIPKGFLYSYFPTLVVIVFVISLLINNEVIRIPAETDLFVVRLLVFINLFVHVVFLIPFLYAKRNAPLLKETGFSKKEAFLFFAGVIAYSAAMSFFNLFGFISTCIAIIMVFAISVFIPAVIKIRSIPPVTEKDMDFDSFCRFYEISKREAEIILEICSGKSNKAIAEKLFITLQTVKDHNHRIYTKTGVRSRVQLANLVREKTGVV